MKTQKALILFALFLCSSCIVQRTNTVKTMDIYGAGVIHKPVLVDLDVKENKITGTSTQSGNKSIEIIKQDAVANALKNANADVLVEPKFETETHQGKVTATVTGFPATYKNFRQIKSEDIPLLQVGIAQKANVYEPPTTKKNNGGAIAAILIGLGLLGVLIGTSTGNK